MGFHSISSRRRFIRTAAAGGGAVALSGLAGCTDSRGGSDDTLTVAVYGGVFKDIMDKVLLEPFAETVDFEVESTAQPTATQALTQYENAVQAGQAPVDVAIMSPFGVLKGLKSDLWHIWDTDDFENLDSVRDTFVRKEAGGISSIGALSYYVNLVQNTNATEETIDSWEMLWDESFENTFGLLGTAPNSALLDVTAELYFDGSAAFESRDNVRKLFDKLQGVKPQARFWYENEAEFQQRLRDGEVPAGMLYNDITLVMQNNGASVQSNFVEEGSILQSGLWTTLQTTKFADGARQFIDYAIRPEVQDRLAKNLYSAPTIERQHSDLSEEFYQKIAGPGPDAAIMPNVEFYVEEQDWVSERWTEFIIN